MGSQVPITIIGAVLMDKSGRRPLIMVNTNIVISQCDSYIKKEGIFITISSANAGFCFWDFPRLHSNWKFFLA